MLNDAQKDIVESRGNNIVVSASAGCGKTTTMIKRIVNLIEREKAELKSMLIVTFTNASARDMKEKLFKELNGLPKDSFIKKQILAVDRADISTIDSFCTRLLRDNYFAAGIDPSFEILDADDAKLLKIKVLKKLVAELTLEGEESFLQLSSVLTRNRREESLFLALLNLYEFSENTADPERYLKETLLLSSNSDLKNNPAYSASVLRIKESLHYFIDELHKMSVDLNRLGLEKDLLSQQEISGMLEGLCGFNSLVHLSAVLADIKLPALKALNKQQKESEPHTTLHESFKNLKKALKKSLDCLKGDYLNYSQSELVEKLNESKVLIETLSKTVLKFKENYSLEKKNKSALDFSDLCHYSLKILEDEELAKEYRSRYRYVFVDECQDINSLQNALIDRLKGHNNLFSVGDLKQCIYRFRGAEPELFFEKCQKAEEDPHSKLFRLGINYRTNTEILDYVNGIFSVLMLKSFSLVDYKKDDLLAGTSDCKISIGQPVEIHVLDTKEEEDTEECEEIEFGSEDCGEDDSEEKQELSLSQKEGYAVCSAITELVNNGRIEDPALIESRILQGKTDRVTYSDIAVIVRGRNAAVRTIYNVMKSANIPVYAEFEGTLSEYKEIAMLLNFLKVTDNFKQDIPLLAVLRSVFGNFCDGELSEIRENNREKYFHEAFIAYSQVGGNETLKIKCGKFCNTVQEYTFLSKFLNVVELIDRILIDFDYETFVLAEINGSEKCAALKAFTDNLYGKSYTTNLYDFLSYCDVFGSDFKIKTSPSSSFECIRLTTMHKSKGLEFPVVILCGLSGRFNLQLKDAILFDKKLGAGIDNYDFSLKQKKALFPFQTVKNLLLEMQIKEELNTLYVAMTRAKYKLILTSAKNQSKYAQLEGEYAVKNIRNFIDPLLYLTQNMGMKFKSVQTDSTAGLQRTVLLTGKENEYTDAVERALNTKYAYQNSLGIKLKNTVTELSREQNSVQRFEGASFSSSVTKGDAYHRFIELMDLSVEKQCIQSELERLLAENLLSESETSLIDLKEIERFLENIKPYLKDKIYREKSFMLYLPYSLLGGNTEDKVLVQGKMDMLIVSKDGATLIDYKLSSLSDTALVEKYRPQLKIYALAVKEILNLNIKDCFLYSFHSGNLIKI